MHDSMFDYSEQDEEFAKWFNHVQSRTLRYLPKETMKYIASAAVTVTIDSDSEEFHEIVANNLVKALLELMAMAESLKINVAELAIARIKEKERG